MFWEWLCFDCLHSGVLQTKCKKQSLSLRDNMMLCNSTFVAKRVYFLRRGALFNSWSKWLSHEIQLFPSSAGDSQVWLTCFTDEKDGTNQRQSYSQQISGIVAEIFASWMLGICRILVTTTPKFLGCLHVGGSITLGEITLTLAEIKF